MGLRATSKQGPRGAEGVGTGAATSPRAMCGRDVAGRIRPLLALGCAVEFTVQVLSLRRIQPPGPKLGLVRLRVGGEGAP